MAQQRYAAFQREVWEVLKRIDLNRVRDPRFVRQLTFLKLVGPSALPIDEYDRVSTCDTIAITIVFSFTQCLLFMLFNNIEFYSVSIKEVNL